MISKLLLMSATATGLVMAQPQTASAGVNVDVAIQGMPTTYQPIQYYPDGGYPSYHDYDDEDENDGISCWEGRRIVREAGYRGVATITCYGEIYRYRGWKRGHQWRVSVDSDTGRIIRVRPLDYY